VWGDAFGLSYTFKPAGAPFVVSAQAAVPLVWLSVHSDKPLVAIDRSGLGDIFVQPVKLGWQRPHYDLVTSYSLLAPTGRFEPRSDASVGRGYWGHILSIGGAGYLDTAHTTLASALVSYDLNQRKRGSTSRAGTCWRFRAVPAWELSGY
jgi:hypothetical protein